LTFSEGSIPFLPYYPVLSSENLQPTKANSGVPLTLKKSEMYPEKAAPGRKSRKIPKNSVFPLDSL
jgi:hypothetical protein